MNAPLRPPSPAAPLAELEPWLAVRLRPLACGWLDAEDVRRGGDEGFSGSSHPAVHAAVLVGLVPSPEGWSLILTRRADTLRRHSGQIALPGGRADGGETPVEAALREAHEEIGLEPRFVRPVGLGDPYRTRTGFEILAVVAFVTPGFVLQPAAEEVAEVFETPFAFVMDVANHAVRTWEGPDGERRSYYAMVHGEREIWGATAGVLRGLYERLFVTP